MKKGIFIAAAVLFSSYAHAQEDTASKILNEVIITANKFEQKQSETGKVIATITQDQIQKSFGNYRRVIESTGRCYHQRRR